MSKKLATDTLTVLHGDYTGGIKSYREMISEGKCTDYADYKYLCGIVEGLRIAQERVLELSRRFEEDEED